MMEIEKNGRIVSKQRKKARTDALSTGAEILFNGIIALFSLVCIIPFLFVIIISLTDETTLAENGFTFFPEKMSLYAYEYVFKSSDALVSSFSVSVFVTAAGTLIALVITSMYAYVLFRKDYKYKKFFTFIIAFTMLFGGGLVPFYITMTQFLHLRNSLWALIIPSCLSAFHVIVLRTFFTTTVPESLIDSAMMDGSGEFRTFLQIVLPISLPGIATIGLFTSLGYWNEWFNALLFIDKKNLMPLQYLLIEIQNKVDFLTQFSKQMNAGEISAVTSTLPRESMKMVLVVISVLPISCAYPLFQRYFIQGLTIGAVKG